MKLNNLDILSTRSFIRQAQGQHPAAALAFHFTLTILLVFPLLYISYTERRHALKITHNCDHKQDIAMANLGLWGSEVTCVGH